MGIAFCVLFIISSLIAIRMIACFVGGSFFSIGATELLRAALMQGGAGGVHHRHSLRTADADGEAERSSTLRVRRQSALLPLAALNFVAGTLSTSNGGGIALVAVFSTCYMILLLHAVPRRPEYRAPTGGGIGAVILPATGWLTKVILAATC